MEDFFCEVFKTSVCANCSYCTVGKRAKGLYCTSAKVDKIFRNKFPPWSSGDFMGKEKGEPTRVFGDFSRFFEPSCPESEET
jgi:hypothetical protein